MKKGYIQVGFATALFISALASMSFQESPKYPDQVKQEPLKVVQPKQDEEWATLKKEIEEAKKELIEAKKQLADYKAADDAEYKVRSTNYNKLEKHAAGLETEVKSLKKAVGSLVNILTNFPADSTLRTFDPKGIDVDTLKKNIELPEIDYKPQKKGFFKRLFKRK